MTTKAPRESAESDRGDAAPGLRWPAEWEPHEATWLSWPHNRETWPGRLDAVEEIFGVLTRELSFRERVRINVADVAMIERAQKVLRRAGVEVSAPVEFFEIPTDDAWVRDHGGVFVVRENNATVEKVLVDFHFDAWGKKYPPWDRDEAVARSMAEATGLPRIAAEFTLEGGSIDGNGEGTVLTTESCLLHPNREVGRHRAQMEHRLARTLGTTHVHWLAHGIEGDDTDGHIDDLARFVSPSTIVASITHDADDPNYQRLQDNFLQLRSLNRPDGGSFEIVSLPTPRVRTRRGDCLPASYANFFVANGVVLVPCFDLESDEKALSILGEVFAGRDVIGIPSCDLIRGLGAVHCLTQQEPAV